MSEKDSQECCFICDVVLDDDDRYGDDDFPLCRECHDKVAELITRLIEMTTFTPEQIPFTFGGE